MSYYEMFNSEFLSGNQLFLMKNGNTVSRKTALKNRFEIVDGTLHWTGSPIIDHTGNIIYPVIDSNHTMHIDSFPDSFSFKEKENEIRKNMEEIDKLSEDLSIMIKILVITVSFFSVLLFIQLF